MRNSNRQWGHPYRKRQAAAYSGTKKTNITTQTTVPSTKKMIKVQDDKNLAAISVKPREDVLFGFSQGRASCWMETCDNEIRTRTKKKNHDTTTPTQAYNRKNRLGKSRGGNKGGRETLDATSCTAAHKKKNASYIIQTIRRATKSGARNACRKRARLSWT